MAKFYLVRRNLETFVGPLTAAEMKDAYKRMAFGLQDEVSGHCGPWVTLEHADRIKKHYPEVARIVGEDANGAWGVSQHDTRRLPTATKRVDVRGTRGIGLALAFLAIAIAAFAAAVYMANNAKMSGKLGPAEPTPEEAQAYLDRGDVIGFDDYIAGNSDDLVLRVVTYKKGESPWLPYLRHWAFQHEGMVNGLSPKVLRGNASASAPIDCSLRTWRKRWRASLKQWTQLTNERKLVRDHWARMLAWDPHWIRRRDNKGWMGAENYYIGCLEMADKALGELATDPSLVSTAADWSKLGYDKVRQRLAWVLDMARDGVSRQGSVPATDDNLPLWNCFEAAKDSVALVKCRDGMGQIDDAWQAYNEERFGWNVLRLGMAIKGPMPSDMQGALVQLSAKMTKGDQFTRFDYRAELKLLKTLAKATGPVEKVIEKAQSEFPDVKLAH